MRNDAMIADMSGLSGAVARIVVAVCLVGCGLPAQAEEPPRQAAEVRVATFDVDATPPVGVSMAFQHVVREPELRLRCRGVVILGAGEPIVLCVLDWLGIGNESHDAFRAGLAEAAGTRPDRVAVHATHAHDAPYSDFTAERILRGFGIRSASRFDGDFHREVIKRGAAAIRDALPMARPATHWGFGSAAVHEVASNRRILGPDGKVRVTRYTACGDAALRAEPEGVIDPLVTAVAFFDGETPVAVVTAYACHPQSYYRAGVPSPDFPGIARFIRSQDEPAALHVHFNGAGGNIGAGKYNDGAKTNRVKLAERLAAGMREAYAAIERRPLRAADVGWSGVDVVLEPAERFDEQALVEQLRREPPQEPLAPLQSVIEELAWVTRCRSGHAICVTCLRVGTARMLHLPGELFVEYQLAARAMRPDLHVMVAAYGNYGPSYIGTARAYDEGGYEMEPRSTFVGPEVEPKLLAAMRTLLEATP
jgi:hypothetical protein